MTSPSPCAAWQASSNVKVALLAVGSRGDLQPLIALGTGLRKRGHAVRLATHGEFQALVNEAGLEYFWLPGGPSTIPSEVNSPWRLIRALVKYLDQIGPQVAEQTRMVCEGHDLVVENMLSHTGAVERLTAPWCMAVFLPLMPTSAFPAPGLPALPFGGVYNRATHVAAYRLQQLQLRRWVGIASKEITFPWQELSRNRPALFAFSPSVIPRPADWSSTCHVTGYWFWERTYEPPPELLGFLRKGPQPVALTFGSMWRFAPANVA